MKGKLSIMSTFKEKYKHIPQISVIVPVYNSEKYIRPMLDSLCSQTFSDFEVLIINDGSTDSSQEIINEYTNKDSRFISYQQENMGVSAARNKGIEEATGKYAIFYDSDDIVPRRALEWLFSEMETKSADLCIGIVKKLYSDDFESVLPITRKIARMEKIDVCEPYLVYSFILMNKMFSLKIIKDNNLVFEDVSHTEDGLFIFHYYKHCKKIVGCDHIVYRYRQRFFWEERSLLNTITLNQYSDSIYSLEHLASCAKETVKDRLCEFFSTCLDDSNEDLNCQYDEYVSMLYKRLISTSLVNFFYRRIWMADNDEALVNNINSKIKEYKQFVNKKHWDEIVRAQVDLNLDSDLPTRNYLYQHSCVSFIITNAVSKNSITWIIKGLYYQNLPSFEIITDSIFKEDIINEIGIFPNIVFQDDVTITSLSKLSIRGRCVNIINEELAPGQIAILNQYKDLIRSPELDFITCPIYIKKGDSIKSTDLYNPKLQNNNPAIFHHIDCIWGNKLFRKEVFEELANSIELTNNHFINNLHDDYSYSYNTQIFFISLFDENYIINNASTSYSDIQTALQSLENRKGRNKLLNRIMNKLKKVIKKGNKN